MSNVENRDGDSAVNKMRKKGKNVEKPTTAVAEKNLKKVFDALNEVDPARISEVLKNSATEFNKINTFLNMASSSSGGGGSKPNSGVKKMLTDALTGALCILVKRHGYITVLTFFTNLLTISNYNLLLDDYKEIVKNAMEKLYITVLMYGEKNIPVSIIPAIILGDKVPSTLISEVPDLYVQQYFTSDNDPFPGYIQWIGPDDDIVYTLRTPSDPPFDTSEEHVYSIAEQGLANDLDVYFIDKTLVLTIQKFSELLIYYCNLMEDQAIKSTVGKNANNMSGNLAQLLGGILSSLVSQAQAGHIPPSVLDKGKMNQLISDNNKMQGRLNSFIKPSLKKAVAGEMDDMSGMMSNFLGGGNLSSLSGLMSNLSSLTGGVNTSLPSVPPVPQANVETAIKTVSAAQDIETTMKCLKNFV
jgi:hypothetical protein